MSKIDRIAYRLFVKANGGDRRLLPQWIDLSYRTQTYHRKLASIYPKSLLRALEE